MKNKVILGVVGIIVLVGIIFVAMKGDNNSQVAKNAGVYCSSDGTLADTMPIQSHRSYCVKSDSTGKTYSANIPNEYSFSIVDDQGNTLKDFAITHTKPMHVIVVRKDLAYFQHVHPKFNQATGQFMFSDLTFPADGLYRIFSDFASVDGQKDPSGMPLTITISQDIPVGMGASYAPKALGSEEKAKTFDGYRVVFSSDQPLVSGREIMITFNLKESSKSITDLQEYLGALGHAVVLREGNLDFIHAHPVEDTSYPQTGKINFMVDFPEAGKYKIFTQFQRNGNVFTTNFIVNVIEGVENSPGGTMMH